MRLLTSLSDESQAEKFVAYLAVESIATTLEYEDGEWTIWIHDDEDRDRASEMLADFQREPDHARYDRAERKVRHVLREADRLRKIQRDRSEQLKKRWDGHWWYCFPATYIMICISLLTAIICTQIDPVEFGSVGPLLCNNRQSSLRNQMEAATPVRYSEKARAPMFYFPRWPGLSRWDAWWPSISDNASVLWLSVKQTLGAGEVWRFFTPIFLHFNFLHILFNMMWLRSLGGAIEFVRGTRRFVPLCAVLAMTSNLAQLYWSGPGFGGMSGVVFGLIGYAWMKGRYQPHLGIALTQQQIVYSILWLVLCMGGVFGPIANAAHLIGLLAGMAIGSRQHFLKRVHFWK